MSNSPEVDLSKLFPEAVVVRPEGSALYHYSRNLDRLMDRNRFDPAKSRFQGSFYFTDVPALFTNCQVTLNKNLLMYSLNDLSDLQLKQIALQGNGDAWIGAGALGFDGREFSTPDPYVMTETGSHATEIVVFRFSLHKLGRIVPFTK